MARRWSSTLAASTASLVLVGVGLLSTTQAFAEPTPASQSPEVTVDPCEAADQNPEYQHDAQVAIMTVAKKNEECLRTYELDSGLLDSDIDRVFTEREDRPLVRTGSPMLDGLFAMAVTEEGLLSTDSLQNWGYNNGFPMSCVIDGVGCYNTGEGWGFVWTRDMSYSADLGMASMDPIRMRNSLLFKLSDRRDIQGGSQIIQDTGSGGSYPNSTDRVTWAIGAEKVLPWLKDEDRAAFASKTYEALRNTVEHDRGVVYNPKTGLYMGETSFLDWRQQTYAPWTANDVTDITESESLSTNINHYNAIMVTSELALKNGDVVAAVKYAAWSQQLLAAIRAKFWLPEQGQFASFTASELNRSASEKYDALAVALAVLEGVATPEQASRAIANYPQTPYGPPVIWPAQQEDTRQYHNMGIWPFVTAYMLKAAVKANNDQAATDQVDSMVRQAAMFATNYENMSIMNGGVAGMALNNKRQTWSVSGTIGMFQDVFFGIEAVDKGLVVSPYLPAQVRNEYFPDRQQIAYKNLDFRGKKVDVVLDLPPVSDDLGAYEVESIWVDGTAHKVGDVIPFEDLGDHSVVIVRLGTPLGTTEGPHVIASDNTGDGDVALPYAGKEAIFAPKTPSVHDLTPTDDGAAMKFNIDLNGEDPAAIKMDVIRDGQIVAKDLDAATMWTDTTATDASEISYCYSVRLKYRSSGNASQDADALCYWGPNFDRVLKVLPNDTGKFILEGTGVGDDKPKIVAALNRVENWGTNDDHRITAIFTPTVTGTYKIQTDYSLGSDIQTGVTSALKLATVYDATDDSKVQVGQGVLVMPHTNNWNTVRGSTFVDVHLLGGHKYQVVLENDLQRYRTVNMSYFKHNALYNDTSGHWRNKANIYGVKLLLKEAGDATPVLVDPVKPARVGNTVVIPALVGVTYLDGDGNALTGEVRVPSTNLVVRAVAGEGYKLNPELRASWLFPFDTNVDRVLVDPVRPVQVGNKVTVPVVEGITYVDGSGSVLAGEVQVPFNNLTVVAVAKSGYRLNPELRASWLFAFDMNARTVVDPVRPVQVGNTVTIPVVEGVVYKDGAGSVLAAGPVPVTTSNLVVVASPAVGYRLNPELRASWLFAFDMNARTMVDPLKPVRDGRSITIPTIPGVIYKDGDGNTITGQLPIPSTNLVVKAIPDTGYRLNPELRASWLFPY